MPSQMASETPDFRPVARWDTVEGVLEALNVTDAPKEEQRSAIRKSLEIPGLRRLLNPLLEELQTRDLL